MPMPGDQHRENAATANPFLEQKQRVTEYTAQEIATLQSRLGKQLGPEYISTRQGNGGGKVHYLAGEKVINLANEVFGFNGWSSAIQNVQIDFVDESRETGRVTLGLSTIVRVTLRDGTFHEDIGYGHIENCKGKAAAFEKAKKEAATDALKRALRNFGNVLGNCLYDKDYLARVTKVKYAPSKWDAENLHRHPDFAPIKKESIADSEVQKAKSSAAQRQPSGQSVASFGSMEFDDDFGGNPFDETDFSHPGEALLNETSAMETPVKKPNAATPLAAQQNAGVPRVHSMPQMRPPNIPPPPPVQNPQQPQRPPGPPKPPNNAAETQPNRMLPPQAPGNQQRPGLSAMAGAAQAASRPVHASTTVAAPTNQPCKDQHEQSGLLAQAAPPPGTPDGFVSGRNVDLLNQPPGARPANTSLAFNPHAETPSIRRTNGVNPGKSAPVTRQSLNGISGAGPANPPSGPPNGANSVPHGPGNGMNGATTPVRTNFVNPSMDMNRRIGMPPGAAQHSVPNRGAYKPPTALKRPALTDVSNIQQVDGPGEAKKAKLDDQTAALNCEAAAAPAAT